MQIIIDFDEREAGKFVVLHKRHLLVVLSAVLLVLSAVVYGIAHQVAHHWVVSGNSLIAEIVRDEIATINKDRRRLWDSGVNALQRDIADFNARLIALTQRGNAIVEYLDLSEDAMVFGPPEQLCQSDEPSPVADELLEERASLLSANLFKQKQALAVLERRYGLLAEQSVHRAALDKTTPIRRPVLGKNWLVSGYGYRKDPFTGRKAFHAGTDYAARTGTPIIASAAGVVIYAGRLGNYGNAVHLYHGDKVSSLYGHMKTTNVELFQFVNQGDVIGTVGSTGRSTGPHLHYEVRIDKRSRPLNKTIKSLREARDLS